ncbi:MAG: hypothetical protein PHS14_07965 [Elusimicrobia bacterium]|nr:hypothetical protein [Elusimicrobiota bacterium]
MSVDAGSINSEVRIKLSALNADILACKTAFDNLGKEFADSSEKYSTNAGTRYKNTLKNIAAEMKNVEGAMKAGALSEQQAVQRLINLRKTELQVLQNKAVKEGTASAETVAAIKKTEAALDSLQQKQKILEGGKQGGGFVGAFGKMRDAMLGPVAVAKEVINAIQSIIAKASEMEDAWAEQAEATALVENTLKMTGATAWTTSEHLHELASSLQDTTKYGDETILSMQSVLLGFRNIQGVNFDKATEAVLDMATVMKMDLTAAAQAVGKALDNPALGLDSLSKQGFKFTQQEKDMMKAMQDAGDIAGAQAIIMGELEKTFGGASKAVGDLDISLRDKLKNAVGDVNEEIGRSISRTLAPWREAWLGVVQAVGKAAKAQNDFTEAWDRSRKARNGEETRSLEKQLEDLEIQRKYYEKARAGEQAFALGGGMGTAKVKSDKLFQKELDEINKQIEALSKLKKEQDEVAKKRADQIEQEDKDEAQRQKNAEWQAKLEAERAKITKDYSDDLARISREEAAGALTSAEAAKERLSATENEYQALDKLIVSMGVGQGTTTDMRDATLALVVSMREEVEASDDAQKAINAQSKAEADAAKAKRDSLIKSNMDAIKSYDDETRAVEKATEGYDKQAQAIERGSLSAKDKLEDERKDALNAAEAWEKKGQNVDGLRESINKYYDLLADGEEKKALADSKRSWQDYADAVIGVIDAIATAGTEMYARQIDALEERYQREQELIENDGLTKRQALEAEVEAAVAAGDAEAEVEARKKLALFALEEDFEKKKAQLQYKADMEAWTAKGFTIAADIAAAIAEALPNLVLVGITAAAGIAQTVAYMASKPKPPALATGGIVLPSGNDGRQVVAGDKGGADIFFGTSALGQPLMQEFAAQVAAAVVSSIQGSQGQAIVVQLTLDGRVIAESTVRQINDGAVRLSR